MCAARARAIHEKQAAISHQQNSGRPNKDKPPVNLPEVKTGDARDAAGKAVGVSGRLIGQFAFDPAIAVHSRSFFL